MDESITKTTKFEEQSSWGDTIRAYEASKKNLHWDVNDESAKVKRINLRERRCQERELDPVLMKYRDDDKEQNYMMKKASKSQLVLDRVATASATRFNIINHNGPSKNNGPYNQSEKSAKSLHLISNLLGKDHKEAPILYDEKFYSQRFVSKTEKIAKRVNSREFNIVSNNYYRNHNERIQEEFEKLQSEVTKKYWETHGYNPVIAQYYSDADEERYNAKLKEVEAMQGKSQACRLPPG